MTTGLSAGRAKINAPSDPILSPAPCFCEPEGFRLANSPSPHPAEGTQPLGTPIVYHSAMLSVKPLPEFFYQKTRNFINLLSHIGRMFRVKWPNALIYPKVAPVSLTHTSATEGAEMAFHIEGLLCGLCALRVRRALESLEGAQRVEVDFETQMARIWFAPGSAPDPALAATTVDRIVLAKPLRRLLEGLGKIVSILSTR